ncbi:NAD(P)/FAD-dependent oxidoreductase [Belliella kenyensis]|uniref:NADH:ubiquinone reductase (non-electrogenic) n=1 Tax=Belliella kenyensis TaxID=1472724 RepID=A0ABV8EKR2_9BACT|nr:NAD(P)/FAD-dependent oxidoreductase [Belliella kenyensis]MCH7401373.1 NAD(P)/FAD-dependent oxidoreductase [Belliella kenyensis]MDN3602816.1 NAD(P)/FAD-dependent oxidoreductase [Belliella kenyensis]
MDFYKNSPLPNLPKSDLPKVVIIGAGFAGLKMARKLMGKPFQVLLLDKNNYHQFQPLFYQVATSGLEPSAISFPLRKVFHHSKNVTFRMAEAKQIDQENNRLYTNVGYVDYDYLVLALGTDTNFFGLKNVEAKSSPMKSVSEALYIRNKIIANYETAINVADVNERKPIMNIVIVGGGPTGVELAGAVAELRNNVFPKDYPELSFKNMKVVLIEAGPNLLASMSDIAKEKAKSYLENLGVDVMLDTQVSDYDGELVYLKGKESIKTKTLLWAAGVKANRIKGLIEDQVLPNGRLVVDHYNKLTCSENIFVLGDMALMITDEYPNGHPQIAQVALQQGNNLANNLINNPNGKNWKPFQYKDLGSMATIGRKLAVVDLPFVKFQGLLAWLTWLFVHLMAILGVKNKLFIFINWAWNYLAFDPSLRLLIRPKMPNKEEKEELVES